MRAVILAGGLGTRLSEETHSIPKPMVRVGGYPILWHIMKIYSAHGINEFLICLGYKGYVIKEYFINYHRHMSDLTIDLSNNSVTTHNVYSEPWKVTLVNTGEKSLTGSRIKNISDYIDDDEDFCLTYGDGVADINLKALTDFHKSHGKLATVTAVKPAGRFGALDISLENEVKNFVEKPKGDGNFINGGFFVLNKKALDYIKDDPEGKQIWEQEPLKKITSDGQLMSYKHEGFWQAMDTLRDKNYLEDLWGEDKAPWKVW
jgi:glucose-1-phosphate cytidylyltransferase